jgi:hypothetical protein
VIMEIELPPNVREEDLHKMIRSLEAYRGDQWWFKQENPHEKGRFLTALTLNNMLLGVEDGTVEPNPHNFKNAVMTALYFEKKCRDLMTDFNTSEQKTPTEAQTLAALHAFNGGEQGTFEEFEAMHRALIAASEIK